MYNTTRPDPLIRLLNEQHATYFSSAKFGSKFIFVFLFFFGPCLTKAPLLGNQSNSTINDKTFDEIINRYQIIGDFRTRPAERPVSKEFFWRYPFPLPKAVFPINHSLGDLPEELPSTEGNTKPIQHMNFGRIIFRRNKFEEARKIWLAGRARYGKSYPFHRRNDYFISLAYLKISEGIFKQFNYNRFDKGVRLTYSNTATFLSWAFIKKRDLEDAELDKITPRALYNLAAIYYKFDRYNGAHGTAEEGLNFLRKTGRKDYRPHFRRIISETWIRDRQYLNAVRELDTIIRQEKNMTQAVHSFVRLGDIYFDLNNYHLAEEAYHLSQKINQKIGKVLPLSFILRGESLFWLGKFEEAQKALKYGINSISYKHAQQKVSDNFRSFAYLRIADAYLARYKDDMKNRGLLSNAKKIPSLLSKARLTYHKVSHEFPHTEAAKIAKIRRACLGLPVYLGNNIKHARNDLIAAKSELIPLQALELAGSCYVLSYSDVSKNSEVFVEKVKEFYKSFPKSRFLGQYIEPLKELRRQHLDNFLEKKSYHKAITYFEDNRNVLFKNLNILQKQSLFEAYLEVMQADKAAEFWSDFSKKNLLHDHNFIKAAVFLSEVTKKGPHGKKWGGILAGLITKKQTKKMDLKMTDTNRNSLLRILNAPRFKSNLPWIYFVVKKWGKDNRQILCQLVYPTLSKWNQSNPSATQKKLIWNEISKITQKEFPLLFSISPGCSESFLNLEKSAGSAKAFWYSLGHRWTKRFDWPQKKNNLPYSLSSS